MANSNRRRISFVDFSHPQVWHKLIEYAEVTIAFTKLITDFTNQWAKICFLASSQLHQLVAEFRRKTESEIRDKCHLGGMMYDLWESLLLESELESQSVKKMACLMEKEICAPLTSFVTNKNVELTINKQHRRDLNDILERSHEIVQEVTMNIIDIENKTTKQKLQLCFLFGSKHCVFLWIIIIMILMLAYLSEQYMNKQFITDLSSVVSPGWKQLQESLCKYSTIDMPCIEPHCYIECSIMYKSNESAELIQYKSLEKL
ncbi:unnamed protein product [Rotaria magnacalcarata]|uniref:Uncharacterized protein n=1 Tax=Rotaria magnacalcarata TaxID=392030 RepID=A0A819CB13_9BILA|nr:unnamed protein product [Rotaria magnacalcarata]